MDTGANDMLSKTQQVSIMDMGKQLLEAAANDEPSKVHELMCRGAPFTTDWLGKSPLHVAAENNRLPTCEILLRAGISKDSRTKVDRTPLHLAVFSGHDEIVRLLLQHKCDVNAKDMHKMTALHWAVEEEHIELVRVLLKHGADPTAVSKYGETPLSIADEMGCADVTQVLVAHGNRAIVSQEEQQVATDSLLDAMERDKSNHIDLLDSPDDITASPFQFPANVNRLSQAHSPTLQMLGDEMPPDDANNFLQSAYACGRRIVVTDFGKQMMLKVQNSNANTTIPVASAPITVQAKNGDTKAKQPLNVLVTNATAPKLLSKPNVLKRLSSEELTKLVGDGRLKTMASPAASISNGSLRFPKYRLTSMPKISHADSTANVTAVKVFNKSPMMAGAAMAPLPIPTVNAKKMILKKDAAQIASLNHDTNHIKPIINVGVKMDGANDTKMIQVPLNDYLELKKKVQTLSKQCTESEARLMALEKHCGLR